MSSLLGTAERRHVAAGGVRLLVHRAEPARHRRTTPVLLLHGVPQTAGMWRDVLAELRRDRVVIAPDLPGLGGSEVTGRYDARSVADALAALVLHEVDGPVDVVGHDWGGVAAMALAGARPELVRRLAVLDAPYRRLDPLHAWYMGVFAAPLLPEVGFRVAGATIVRTMLQVGWYAQRPLDPAAEVEYVTAYTDPARVSAMLGYYRQALRPRLARAVLPRRARSLLGSGTVGGSGRPRLGRPAAERTLVVWGARDPALPVAVGEQTARDLGAGTEFVTVPGVGHFVAEEAPEVVVPLLADFLRA